MKKNSVPAFKSVLDTLEELANQEYQLRQWVAREDPNDYGCYENATMNFLWDCQALIDARDAGRVEIPDIQYQLLTNFYHMVDAYDASEDRPEEDEGIVHDPKWHKIRKHAKLVYDELKKDS